MLINYETIKINKFNYYTLHTLQHHKVKKFLDDLFSIIVHLFDHTITVIISSF